MAWFSLKLIHKWKDYHYLVHLNGKTMESILLKQFACLFLSLLLYSITLKLLHGW